MKHTAIILGGGAGKRFKGEIPKQFLPLVERPMIVHTVEAFQSSPSIDAIIVAVPAGWEKRCANDLKPYDLTKVQGIITGGETRQLSCWQVLQYLKDDPPNICVIHDAARPLVSATMIETAVREGDEGMSFCLPAVETIVEWSDGEIVRVLPRDELCQVQTPQAFPFKILWDAHCRALEAGITDASDDAGIVFKAGNRVRVLEGDPRNIKITGPVDLKLAQYLLGDG
ncbi:MAG: 2-C-methyl-D-erythritol 4-phosphate cytidylyltransferase [Deltaproteobacteria bacterium]|nr:2-C-methyl-D-erythritol 4-phosphate cytidylyltransferase [Deltaproteobacteria bacterium]